MTEPFLPNIPGVHHDQTQSNKKYIIIGSISAIIAILIGVIFYLIFANTQIISSRATVNEQSAQSSSDIVLSDQDILIESIQNNRKTIKNTEHKDSIVESESSSVRQSSPKLETKSSDQSLSTQDEELVEVVLQANLELQQVGTYNIFCLDNMIITSDYRVSDSKISYIGYANLPAGSYTFRHFNTNGLGDDLSYVTCQYHNTTSQGLFYEQNVSIQKAQSTKSSRLVYEWQESNVQEVRVFN